VEALGRGDVLAGDQLVFCREEVGGDRALPSTGVGVFAATGDDRIASMHNGWMQQLPRLLQSNGLTFPALVLSAAAVAAD